MYTHAHVCLHACMNRVCVYVCGHVRRRHQSEEWLLYAGHVCLYVYVRYARAWECESVRVRESAFFIYWKSVLGL